MLFRATKTGEAVLGAERDPDTGELTGRVRKGIVREGVEWEHKGAPEDIPATWAEPIDESAKRQYAVMHKEKPEKYRRKEWVDLSLLEPPKRGPGRSKKSAKKDEEQEAEVAEATPES